MKRKPILGETLYDLNIGNAAGRGVPQVLTPVKVASVGRKYFTCAPEGREWAAVKYHIDTWAEKSDFCKDHKLYASPQEWEDAKEVAALADMIRNYFGGYGKCNVPLENLRKIKDLLT